MKKLILLAAMFATVLSVSAQRNMQVWGDGSYSEFSTNDVDSVTFLLSPNGTPRTYVTPQFKIESDYWFVSYDEGMTWTQLGKATGEQGAQGPQGEKGDKGDKGDSMFLSVTQDDNYIYLLMTDSTKIQIAKANKSDSTTSQPNSEFLFEITYDANGGVGYMSKDTFYYGMSGDLQYCKFTYNGRNFAGWNTQRNGAGVSYNNGARLMISKDITLYAQWSVENIPLSGTFSISDTQKVVFSKGNLQYQASTDTWRFAEHQYDYIGEANSNIAIDYDGWIDLFGWGTGNTPLTTSGNYTAYVNFIDWGINVIGQYSPNTWRTLTSEEWTYILMERPNSEKLCGLATVQGIVGLVILPDNWTTPAGIVFTPSYEKGDMNKAYNGYWRKSSSELSHWDDNAYGLGTWRKMENEGAVFLPAAGQRDVNTVILMQVSGYYWLNTKENEVFRSSVYFAEDGFGGQSANGFWGMTVRLVQDVK